jgi:glutathione synthase/RimK-type ligase-like ATP-grasp enzyme
MANFQLQDKRVLLVGSGFSNLTSYLKERGVDYIVLKDRLTAKNPDKKLKHRVVCDFSSRESVLACVDTIKKPIDAVMTVYENYILPASWITKHLGLPGMPEQAATACTDKFVMRQLFAEAPQKISPDFALVGSEDDLTAFAATHQFPLILKPANLAKSLLVTKNENLDELLANYRRAMAQIGDIYAKYAAHRTPTLLVEEFLEGTIHSVDAFIDAEGEPLVLDQIVDYQTGYDIGFADNFHYSRIMPSALSTADQQALRQTAALGAKALGMRSSPAHIEIIMTKNGPRIVEIGARNGGYRERMHRLANDIDIIGSALALAFGQQPQVQAQKSEPCAVLEIFPKKPGLFSGISHEDALKALPSLVYFTVKAKLGQAVGKAADGHKMCAIVILHHADAGTFAQDLDFVTNSVQALTEPA